MMKSSHLLSGLRRGVALFAITLALFAGAVSFADAAGNVSGYAWSYNIGWISFSCENEDSCDSVDYGVNKNADGTLTGYAWSSNIGWIKFGGLTGFPTGNGTVADNARVNGTDLEGWARALSHGGGWDGWISLSGSYGGGTYGVDITDGRRFTGHAWGDTVVGWVLFDVTGSGVVLDGSVSLDVKSGGVSLAGNGNVTYATVPTFEWTITDLPSTSCEITKTAGGSPFTPVTDITESGSAVRQALVSSGLHTYALNCTNPTDSKTVSFTVASQPPGFSLGNTEYAGIQFVGTGAAETETENIFVYGNQSFIDAGNPVDISITTYPTPPAGTTFLYSLGGSAYDATAPTARINAPYSSAAAFKVRVSKPITERYTVRVTGTAAGAPTVTKDIIIDPVGFDPSYEEL